MTTQPGQDFFVIGIDPDTNKSGIAIKNCVKGGSIELLSLTFFQLYEYLKSHKEKIRTVRIEASWLIKHNWNKNHLGSAALNANIGNAAGRNHETGRKLVEMCQHLGIAYEEVRPLKKHWKGSNGKITHAELSTMVSLPTRTNQEERDACLLIL